MIRGCAVIAALVVVCLACSFGYLFAPIGPPGDRLAPILGRLPSLGSLPEMLDKPVSADNRPVEFAVHDGDDARSVGLRLKIAGLIQDDQVFRLVASSTGLGARMAVGVYELRRDMTSKAILEKFAKGEVKTKVTTIPEGWRTGQVAELLEKQGLGSADSIAAALAGLERAAPTGTLASVRPAGLSLDGYLFPETYRLRVDGTSADLITAMVRMVDEQFTPELRAAVAARGLNPHQALTLASIIEREAVHPEERPVIASVYLNRLKINMMLQADPTVQYAISADPKRRDPSGYWKKDLTVDDLAFNSPYNTYRVTGLPPGPICSPGLASIKAVAAPADTEFLYFVAKPDGTHAFARTLSEHNANVARYSR